jgi:hypothetical protein
MWDLPFIALAFAALPTLILIVAARPVAAKHVSAAMARPQSSVGGGLPAWFIRWLLVVFFIGFLVKSYSFVIDGVGDAGESGEDLENQE